jgi:hypothetical protein
MNLLRGGILRQSFTKLLSPLTANVIGDDQVLDTCLEITSNSGRESVVDVGIPTNCLSFELENGIQKLTFRLSASRQHQLGERTSDGKRWQQRQ